MYYRLKLIALMSVTAIFSLSLPVYGETSSRILNQNHSSLAQNSTAEADKLFEEGVKLYRQGEYFKALEVYQRVLKLRRSHNDKVGIAQALNKLGEVYYWMSKGDKALEVLQEAL
ncbi:MAG: tetratricopeptide repeat protein, partial [Cyanobacteria bacterium P01_D01_bin.50]